MTRTSRITYIWLVALAAACLFVLYVSSPANAFISTLTHTGDMSDENSGASATYTMNTQLTYSGSAVDGGDDAKALVFDWPTGLQSDPNQVPIADRCNGSGSGFDYNLGAGGLGIPADVATTHATPDYGWCETNAPHSLVGRIRIDVRVVALGTECPAIMRGKFFLLRNRPNPDPEVPVYAGINLSGGMQNAGGGGTCDFLGGLSSVPDMNLTAKIVVRPDDQGLRVIMLNDFPRQQTASGPFGIPITAPLRVDRIAQSLLARTTKGRPFTRVPTRCDGWESIVWAQSYNGGGGQTQYPPGLDGSAGWQRGASTMAPNCDSPPAFNPSISLENLNHQAGASVGVRATMTVPIESDASAAQPSYIKKVSMAMPKEFRINPAIGERLKGTTGHAYANKGCNETQFNKANPEDDPTTGTDAQKCPDWSQIGTAAVHVSAITGDLTGYMFLGQPKTKAEKVSTGECASLASCYTDEEMGMYRLYLWTAVMRGAPLVPWPGSPAVKFEGRARVNLGRSNPNDFSEPVNPNHPLYGQVSVEFGDPSYSPSNSPGLPQFPFDKFVLDFDSNSSGSRTGASGPTGPPITIQDPDRQMLMNPQVCGTYPMDTTFTPWTSPVQGPVTKPNSGSGLTVTAGANGSCDYSTFAPTFSVHLTGDYDPEADPNQVANPPSVPLPGLNNAPKIKGVGMHPTMTFSIQRPDRMDNLKNLKFVMPEGFGGSMKAGGVDGSGNPIVCTVDTLNQIASGALAPSSCPTQGRIGKVRVKTGAGPAPVTLYGDIYLMERKNYDPANGGTAPAASNQIDASMLGVNELTKYTAKLAVVTPASVGPFQLGAVVNKLYMRLNSSTKFQLVSETADAGLDQSIKGIPVLYQDITLKLDGVNKTTGKPFLFLPSKCGVSLGFQGIITSAGLAPATGPSTHLPTATPAGAAATDGCPAQTFVPSVDVTGFATTPATPSGMSVKVTVPQTETGATESTIQQSTINRVRIQFPPGIEMNPAVATHLAACPTAKINADIANANADTNRCEAEYPKSKLGDVYVNTPLLPELPGENYGVKGAMYLEQQGATKETRMRFVLYLAMPGGMQIVRGGAVVAGSTDGPTAGLGSTSETPAPGAVSSSDISGSSQPLSGGQIESDFNGLPDVSYRWMQLDFKGATAPDNHIVPMFITPDPATCPQVNASKVRVSATNTSATPSSVFFPAEDPFTTVADGSHPCRPTQTFAPTAQIQVATNSRTPIATKATAHPDMTATILRPDLQKDLKKTTFHLPPGMTGAPTAALECPTADAEAGNCTAASVVGEVEVELGSGADTIVIDNGKIYNTTPKTADEPARLTTIATIQLGPFDLGKMSIPIETSLRAGDMGLDAAVELPQRFEGIRTHYRRLSMVMYGYADQGTPDPADDKPFLSNPSNCSSNFFTLDAVAADGTTAQAQTPFQATNCQDVPFPSGALPTMTVTPTNFDSESPTGLNIQMTNGNATSFNPTVRAIEIKFPQGMTVNPAVGNDGTDAVCATAVINAGGAGCPVASKRGEVHIKTPLLANTYHGNVYLEEQGPTAATRFRLAMVVKLPGRDLILRGTNEIDGASEVTGPTGQGATDTGNGQITAKFTGLPDLPFWSMDLELDGGNRALLINPATCGSKILTSEITSHTDINSPAQPTSTYSSYEVTGCTSSPPTPSFSAVLEPGKTGEDAYASAGHPNFKLQVGNSGKSPQLKEFDLDLPSGFVADTVATERCSKVDLANFACNDRSIVGDVSTTMGSPSETLSIAGTLYNVVPDSTSEPARLQVVMNVEVGPFKLGKLSIPVTTQMRDDYGITTHTKLPVRYEGIDVFIRSMTINVFGYSKNGTPLDTSDDIPFMINPTKCGNHTVTAHITRASGPPVGAINATPALAIVGCPSTFVSPAVDPGPKLTVTPSSFSPGVPVGQTYEIENGPGNPTLRQISMDMPVGMELNPAVANGLVACTTAQINTQGGVPCEGTTADVGTVWLDTPLLPVRQYGKVFIEEPLGNSADTRYRVAIVVKLPGKNLISRGKVGIDGSTTIASGGLGSTDENATGQMKTEFWGDSIGQPLPDLTFSKMTVMFTGGARALLLNPRTCQSNTFAARFSPHGDGSEPLATASDSYSTAGSPAACDASVFNPAFTGSPSTATSASSPDLTLSVTSPPNDANVKQMDIDLPTGLVAATGNVPLCSNVASAQGNCDSASDVGDVSAWMGTSSTLTDDYRIDGDLFNVAPLRDGSGDLLEPARLSVRINVQVGPFNLGKLVIPITAELRPDWGVTTKATLPARYEGIAVNMRAMAITLKGSVGGKRFAVMPSKCQANTVSNRMTSGVAPIKNVTRTWSVTTNGCAGFNPATKPTIDVTPSTLQAGVPVGMRIDINSADVNQTIKRTEFTFPQGLEINPAFAKGLTPCSTAEINDAINNAGGFCAGASKIADITMTTHLMSSRPTGQMYLETPGATQTDRYRTVVILNLPGRKLVVRGQIAIDGTTTIAPGATGSTSDSATGQLKADFDNIPDLGFTQLRLDFNAGSKAMLVNPTDCSHAYTFTGEFTPNSSATKSSDTDSFTPTGCGASFAPSFTASVSPGQSAGHPDLTMQVKNAANQQELRKLKIKLPVGLVANTTATSSGSACSETQARDALCNPDQIVGDFSTIIGSTDGVPGNEEADRVKLTTGKIYNVTPRRNGGGTMIEPARMQAVMPVQVGPFDLGNLSIPIETKLNPDMSVDADTLIPKRYEGIAVKLRQMDMKLYGIAQGNDFMVNPSKCGTHTITGEMESVEGSTRSGSSAFNVTGCAPVAAAYNPSLTVTNTPATAGAATAMGIDMTLPASGSTTSNVKMTFPVGMELSPGVATQIDTCDLDVTPLASCPADSKIATVSLTTPLLPDVMEGELYLEPSIGLKADTRFRMAMVVHLPGQDLVVRGGTLVDGASDLIDGKGSKGSGNGQITAEFPGLPDLGFSHLALDFTKKLFVNPKTCPGGGFNVDGEFTPHAGATAVARSANFTTTGGTCAAGMDSFAPQWTGSLTDHGTANPAVSGGNPDLKLTVTNPDGEHELKSLDINLPQGLVARTTDVTQCQPLDAEAGNCPSSVVGSVTATIGSFADTLDVTGDIVNVVPAADQPARMYAVVPVLVGPFNLGKLAVDIPTKLNSDLSVTATTELPQRYEGISVRVRKLDMTILGMPSAGKKFLVAPSKCGAGTISADFTSGQAVPKTSTSSFSYTAVTGCPRSFSPNPTMAVSASPAIRNTPSNLTFNFQTSADNPTVEKMHVDLPDDVEINPAFGKSVATCDLSVTPYTSCPAASKIGLVKIKTHLLDPSKWYLGEVYLEPQGSNAATRFRIAIVAHLPGADLLVRGKITVAGSTDITGGTGSTSYVGPGKISADFDAIPDLGFTDLIVSFNTTRPMLINAPAGGTQTLAVTVKPHSSAASATLSPAPTYTTTGGSTPAAFNPTFSASVDNTTAAANPKLTLTVDRSDNDSESLKDFNLELPVGLVASPSATPDASKCSEAQANAGNCAAAAKVGSFTTRFGNGNTATEDLELGGDIFNVTPRRDGGGELTEPARLSAMVDVQVGPYVLGKLPIPITTAMRPDAGINTFTTLPSRYEGIAVRIKQMKIDLLGTVGGNPFMQNPSKCQVNTIRANITSTSGSDTAVKQSSYTTTGCSTIGFGTAPTVDLSVNPAATSQPTALGVEVNSAASNPTIGKLELTLPAGMSVNAQAGNSLVTCSPNPNDAPTYGCAPGALQGTVEVHTPLLGETFDGNVYLEDPIGNDKDARYRMAILIKLPGQAIVVRGRVQIDGSTTIPTGGTGSVDQGTGSVKTIFDAIPDLSFDNFKINLKTGSRALLTNSDSCGTNTATAKVTPSTGDAHAVTSSPTFNLTSGSACDLGGQPFNPELTVNETPGPGITTVSGSNTDLNLTVKAAGSDQQLRNFDLHLPVGLVADTTASTHCTQADAANAACGASSRVGSVSTWMGSGSGETGDPLVISSGEIHNVEPNKDAGGMATEPARLAAIVPVVVGPYDLGKLTIPVTTTLRSDDYGVDAETQIPLKYEGIRVRIQQMKMTMFGVVPATSKGFIKNPTRCTTGSNAISATFTSGGSASPVTKTADYPVTDCATRFFNSAPTIAVSDLNHEIEQPTGLTLDVDTAADNPSISRVKTTMPAGLTLNPAVGNKVWYCAEDADLNAALASDSCDPRSVIGTVEAQTPLLDGTYPGKVVLAKPGATPSERYKLAMIIKVPGTNVIVHGTTTVDGSGQGTAGGSGLIVTDFDNLPDLNFSHMRIHFDNGPDALLANSSQCGTQQFAADFWSHADPSGSGTASPQGPSNQYELSYDGLGGLCPEDEAPAQTRTFDPQFSGSVSTPKAGGNPDVTLKVTRADKTQQLGAFNLQLPPGLVADAVSQAHCSLIDSQNGNCSDPNTIVGTVKTKIGTGSDLLEMTGNVHNVVVPDPEAEPARMAVVFDVEVGPYDLGKLSIPVTTQIVTGASPSDLAIDTFTDVPSRFEGVPVRMREMEIKLKGIVDGKPFMINPSKCGTHTVGAEMVSAGGSSTKNGSFNFTTNGCPASFNPSIDTNISTSQAGIPTDFSFEINVPGNSSSIQAVTTTLPEGFELNPGLANRGGGNNTLQGCETATIDAGGSGCPASSEVGSVTLDTPLLASQRSGKIYLEQDTALPAPATRYKLGLVISLPGPDLIVHGTAQVSGTGQGVNSGTGQVSATFNNLPDLQFSNLTVNFASGPQGLLISPKTGGSYATSAKLTPWSIAGYQTPASATVTRTDSVTIDTTPTTFAPDAFEASVASSDQAASSDLMLKVTARAQDERLKKMTIGLPVGLVANTTAAPQCSNASVIDQSCTAKVGSLATKIGSGDPLALTGDIYNVTPQANEPARLAAAFNVRVGPYDFGRLVIPVATKIRSGSVTYEGQPNPAERRYGIDAIADVPTRFEGVAIQMREIEMTMFGTVPSTGNEFIVNPSECGPHTVSADLESESGAKVTLSGPASTITIGNCASGFRDSNPSISAAVNPNERLMPTNFSLGITSDADNQTIGRIQTTLPAGMAINPGFGATAQWCPEAKVAAGDFSTCAAAQVGTVALTTPLLAGPQNGKVYLVESGATPAERYLLAIVIDVPGQKLIVRGSVAVDGTTDIAANDDMGSTNPAASGQITATFDAIPDLGFTAMSVNFDTTGRSLLANPETCGAQNVTASITPTGSATPAPDAVGSFVTTNGADAGCATGLAMPFAPSFSATFSGPQATQAAGNPDVNFKVSRSDKSQQLEQLDFELPAGLVANTVETPRCDQTLAAQADCPSNTRVGDVTTMVGTGASGELLELSGGVYNVEPTDPENEPARLAAVIGVQVGPYNLGKLSVPVTTEIIGNTAEELRILTHTTLPTRYEGIPVRVRDIEIKLAGKVDGKPFMINPSKCGSHTIKAKMTSSLGVDASPDPQDLFITDGCASAPYAPSLSASLLPDGRAGKPVGLKLGFSFAGTSSSTKSIVTKLPVGMGINPGVGNLGKPNAAEMTCDTSVIDTNIANCPAKSQIGSVKLDTPLLPSQRLGKVYLETPDASGDADKRYRMAVWVDLPGSADLIVHGTATVDGSSDITPGQTGATGAVDSGTGQVIATFDNLPDLQFSNMQVEFNTTGSGKHALLTNPETCGSHTIDADMTPWSRPTTSEPTSTQFTVTGCDGPEGPMTFTAATPTTMVVGAHSDVTMDFARPDGNQSIKNIKFELPKGLVGSADAAPTCLDDATHAQAGVCDPTSKVGEVTIAIGSSEDTYELTGDVFNVVAPADRPAKFVFAARVNVGPFDFGNVVVPVDVNIDPNEYFLWAQTGDMPQRFEGIPVRVSSMNMRLFATAANGPFMSNPRSCNVLDVKAKVNFTSGNPANLTSQIGPFTGCGALNLNDNTIEVSNDFPAQGNNRVPEAPTALRVKVAQGSLPTQAGMKDLSLKLPGFRLNAPAANLLDSNPALSTCSSAQLDAHACPAASRIGTAWLDTPLLPKDVTEIANDPSPTAPKHSLWGAVYLTTPGTAPGDRYRMAIQMSGKTLITIRGVASVDEDPNSPTYGEMTTEFKDLPDIPFEAMEVELTGVTSGSETQPLLLNPENTDTANPKSVTASADITAWSGQSRIGGSAPTSSLDVLAGVAKPFAPTFGSFFSTYESGKHPNTEFTYTRSDGDEDIKSVKMSLPAGFMGSAAAVPLCSLADAAAGSCASASKVGSVDVSVGQFGKSLELEGELFLTAGAGGDIAGMSIKLPAEAGPYTLGNYTTQGRIVVRTADHGIDAVFAEVPRMYKGVPTHIQSMKVKMAGVAQSGKPFLFNSSTCSAQQIQTTLTPFSGAPATLGDDYAATNCAARTFSPSMSFQATSPGDERTAPSWVIKLATNPGDSTLGATTVVLPSVMTVNVAGLVDACTTDDANARNCPAKSKIGTVTINTPLLTYPVTGTVYMAKALTGTGLPDLLIDIPAPIDMQIRGANRFINNAGGASQIQNTFTGLPDMIWSDMTMTIAGGPTGILGVRDDGKCGSATTAFASHSGQQVSGETPVTGLEGFCQKMETTCSNPTVKISTKGARNKGNKKATTQLSLTTASNCRALKTVRVTYPKGTKINKKLITYNKKKKATKKNLKNLTGKSGWLGVNATGFKVQGSNVLTFAKPFADGSRAMAINSKNSAIVLPYKTFCGHIKKGAKYKKALAKCMKKNVTFSFEVTNHDGTSYRYNYTVPAGSKFFK